MMIRRLRDMPTPAELGKLYATPHQHSAWADHRIRVDVTAALAAAALTRPRPLVADLSCGDAAIARRLQLANGATLILGDYAPGYEHTGPIEETIQRLPDGQIDLFICSETIEHLDDPPTVLKAIRAKTDRLILSTPDGETDDSNPEHIWGWDSEALGAMLVEAGFTPAIHTRLDLRPAGFVYCYQIWVCT